MNNLPVDHIAALEIAVDLTADTEVSCSVEANKILARAYLDLSSRLGRGGPQAAVARTDDGKLVASALVALSNLEGRSAERLCRPAELARYLNISPALLTRCNALKNGKRLSDNVRVKLLALISAQQAAVVSAASAQLSVAAHDTEAGLELQLTDCSDCDSKLRFLQEAALKIDPDDIEHESTCVHAECTCPHVCQNGEVLGDDKDSGFVCEAPGKKCDCVVADVEALFELVDGPAVRAAHDASRAPFDLQGWMSSSAQACIINTMRGRSVSARFTAPEMVQATGMHEVRVQLALDALVRSKQLRKQCDELGGHFYERCAKSSAVNN